MNLALRLTTSSLVFVSAISLGAHSSGLIPADSFEPDSTQGQASTLVAGAPQVHNFHVNGDEDWAKFPVVTGEVVTVTTSNLGPGVDTRVTFYDLNGSQLDSNDNDGAGPNSSLTYTVDFDGFLWVVAEDVSATATGAYTLNLLRHDDAFEVDDTPGQASTLSAGFNQAHTFNKDGDEDWAKIAVIAGRKYTIYTHHLDIAVDTVMEVYGSDTTTLIDSSDDGDGLELGSRVIYRATETGFNYIKVAQFGGLGSGPYKLILERDPGVYLDTDANADVFTYSGSAGYWVRNASDGFGHFIDAAGSWNPGWTVSPAEFNADGLTDFFLFNTSSGQWFRMLNDGANGFTSQTDGFWWPGWERYILDLNGDGVSDFFLYDPVSGVWFRCIATPTGFLYEQGGWSPNWEIYPMKLNNDLLGDMFLINRTTGRWFWVFGEDLGFSYPVSEIWYPDWVLYPGDFNGDGLDDLLLHDPPTGTYFVAFNDNPQFTFVHGGWSLGWTPHVADLDGDGNDDLFMHDATTGRWTELISDGNGEFNDFGGEVWSLGWNIHVSDFNGDRRADLLLYHPASGTWYTALNTTLGTFDYYSGVWAPPNLQVVVRPPKR